MRDSGRSVVPEAPCRKGVAPVNSIIDIESFTKDLQRRRSTLAEREETETIKREDYKPTPYLIDTVQLSFMLNDDVCSVTATSHFYRNSNSDDPAGEVTLSGRSDAVLVSVKMNGEIVPADEMEATATSLKLTNVPEDEFDLEVVTELRPQDNKLNNGLYKSSESYFTQCEPEAFRGITFFYDRPDVMAKYTVRIEADKENYPVLLSNGNPKDSGTLANGRHYVWYEDPFNKPSYLFALVAGNLECLEDTFTTMSGKVVQLKVYTQPENVDKIDHCMECLKKAMKWDETRFGLEYDLELFNLVAVDDFNSGAMENKSLNIFNSKYVLASPMTATDNDYSEILGVVGHEYFHNYTGDRVTCRDWFQLTLKEGLTVFRDQEFSSDVDSRPIERIKNVRILRSGQFPSDAGPTAQQIRPDEYVAVDNLYTSTIYDKGAEVVNIYRKVLTDDGFKNGLTKYLTDNDGMAVRCEEFRDAMAAANNKDLTTLFVWYGQAGTPEVTVTPTYDAATKKYTLTVTQFTPQLGDPEQKQPVLIPLQTALFDSTGSPIAVKLEGSSEAPADEIILEFDTAAATYTFTDVPEKPILSTLRTFSAPVKLTVEGQTDEDLIFLYRNDSDYFNRWDAGQTLFKEMIFTFYENEGTGTVPVEFCEAFGSILLDGDMDGRFMTYMLTPPSEAELYLEIEEVNPITLYNSISNITNQVAAYHEQNFRDVLTENDVIEGEVYEPSTEQMSRRAKRNLCLSYLASLEKESDLNDCLNRSETATNLTDVLGAISAINDIDCQQRLTALDTFYTNSGENQLVLNKWLTLSAESNVPDNVSNVEDLFTHPGYDGENPNSIYALFNGFAASTINFHHVSTADGVTTGPGYDLYKEKLIEVDRDNPIAGAKICVPFTQWKQYDIVRQGLMKACVQEIVDNPDVSDNTKELLEQSLQDTS